jgi:hypothetical protein
MKYLCLIYLNEDELYAMPAREMDSLNERHLDFNDDLRKSGHFIEAEALAPGRATAKIRVRKGVSASADRSRENRGGDGHPGARSDRHCAVTDRRGRQRGMARVGTSPPPEPHDAKLDEPHRCSGILESVPGDTGAQAGPIDPEGDGGDADVEACHSSTAALAGSADEADSSRRQEQGTR